MRPLYVSKVAAVVFRKDSNNDDDDDKDPDWTKLLIRRRDERQVYKPFFFSLRFLSSFFTGWHGSI